MRFIISANIKNNPPVYTAVVMFLIFSAFFWAVNWFWYKFKYGLSYEEIFIYLFTDPEFPEKIPLSQVLEDIHIDLFINSIFVLVIASLFIHKPFNIKLKMTLSFLPFVALLLEPAFTLLAYFINPLFIYLKLLMFIVLQFSLGLLIFMSLKFYLSKEKEAVPERSLLYGFIVSFGLCGMMFSFINFFYS